MVGGMISSTILTLVVIPAIYALVKQYGLARRSESGAGTGGASPVAPADRG
jgi:Cu(I)/Ag(I) efflux system membrane protein CusA/SilA